MRLVGRIIALQPSTESYATETAAGVILVVATDIGGTPGTGAHCGTRQSGEVVRLTGSQGTIAHMSSESLMQQLTRLDEYWPGSELLNPNLLFGTAWFWTLPEVHEAQKEIDARNAELRQLINQTL